MGSSTEFILEDFNGSIKNDVMNTRVISIIISCSYFSKLGWVGVFTESKSELEY